MSGAILRKFDVLAIRDPSLGYGGQVPMPQGRIEFYRQGATVSTPSTTIANSFTGTLTVYSLGGLLAGDSVMIGVGGGVVLTVSSVNPSTKQVTLSNSSGASVTVLAGTRLIDLTNRPNAYADELGLAVIGNLVIADSGGRATVFLPEGSYDYVITSASAVTFDAVQSSNLPTAQNTMTWNHTASGTGRVVLVAISWQETTALETLDSVTYGGHAMTRLAFANLVDLFYLVDPPTGSQAIVATWSGSGTKGVAAGSISFNDADQETPFGIPRTAQATGTSAAITISNSIMNGFVLAALGVNTVTGTTTATVDAGSTSRWNLSGGSTGNLNRTLGAGATKLSTAGGSVAVTWTLSALRPWGVIGVEVLPAIRLYADQTGVACSSVPYGINATDYAGIQEAIDALPAIGGVVYVPTGTYRLRTGLTITKPNVTLIGEGVTTIITPDDPTNLPIDLLTIRAAEARLYRLKFDGAAASRDLEHGTCGVIIDGYTGAIAPTRLVQHCYLENVMITGTSKHGLLLRDTILLTAINCEIITNKGDGLRIQGSQPNGTSTTIRFMGCGISSNGGIGANIGDALIPPDTLGTGIGSVTLWGCTLELNEGHTVAEDLSVVGVAVNTQLAYKVEVANCYFEGPPTGCKQFVRFKDSHNARISDCLLAGNPQTPSSGPDRAIAFVGCAFGYCVNNSVEGFKTEIINFDSGCSDCVEMCNRDINTTTGVPRITAGSLTVFGTSQGSVVIPRHLNEMNLPSATLFRPGSMIWVVTINPGSSHLQVSDGTNWLKF